MSKEKLNINNKAPNFKLFGNNGKEYSLESFNNQKLLIYFYPKDDTPGCTIQANDFTTYKKDFEELGYKIIGVSIDDKESHCKFTDKYDLKILLLSDPKKEMMKTYGVDKIGINALGVQRSTFLLNKKHELIYVEYGVKAANHAEKILKIIKQK